METTRESPPSTLFVQLFAKHQCALNSFISSLVPTRADAEDVLQETSLAIWKKWSDFDVSRDFFRWACGIAHIEVVRHRRKAATDRLWFNEELIEVLSFEMIEHSDLFDLRRDALESCIKKLRQEDRNVLELRYQGGMSVEGVADTLGRTTRTIHRTFARIRRLLHQCITATIRSTPGFGA
jgi:RNA polymerase sigma-70 factor, ECF subfamily